MREQMTWEDLGTAVDDLAAKIRADGFSPDAVLALARGGLPCAGALAYALGVKNMATLNVEFYTGVDERLDEPLLLPPVPDLALLRAERWRWRGSSARSTARRYGRQSSMKSRRVSSAAISSGVGPTAGSISRGARRLP